MLQSCSRKTNRNCLFFKDSFNVEFLYSGKFITSQFLAMLQSCSRKTNKNCLFFKDSFNVEFLYSGKCITSQFLFQPYITHQMYSLSFTGFLKQYRIKILVATRNRTRGTTCLMQSALPLSYDNQLANQHFSFVFLLLRGTAMLQSHSQQTDVNSLFFKDSFYPWSFLLC